MEPTSPERHRMLGIEANSSVWELLDVTERTDEEGEDLLGRAYAAAHHWRRAAGRGPENAARADYLIGKSWLALGHPQLALHYGDRVLACCHEHHLVDFDLAYAHELRARALRALGHDDEARAAHRLAVAVEIAEQDDRELLTTDLADF